MAVRGINPIEKHVEKVFLALAAAGLTGVVAWQVAGGSGLVKVNTDEVHADQAYAKLEEKAKALHARLRDPNVTVNEKLQKLPDPRGTFLQQLTGKVAPTDQLAFAGTGIKLQIGADEQGRSGTYLPPNLPASVKPIAHAFMSTVHDGEVASIAALARFMPAKAPFDKAAVSVETTIDPKAIRAALEADPDGPGPMKALLRNWWANTEVVAVEMVRQQRQPDGSWGGEVATPALPGRADFTQALANPAMNSASLNEIIAGATASAEDVLRPQWYRRAELNGFYAGEPWLRPRDAEKQAGRGAVPPMSREQRELRGAIDEIARLESLIENVKKAPTAPPPGGGGNGGKRPGGAGGGGGGLSPGGGVQPRVDPKEEQIKQLERRLEEAKKRKAELERKLAAGAATPGNNPAGDPKPGTREGEPSALLASSEPIAVWHHDIDAARGATYRYQLRVKISNPLYNKPSALPADRADAAKSPTLTIPCADWSDPVHVADEVYCFITSAGGGANQPGGTGLGTAQASLFFFTWGYWRSDVVSLEPGDGMVARWKVPDEAKLAAAPPTPVAPPPAPGPGAGGRRTGAAIGGGGAAPSPNAPAAPTPSAATPLPFKEVTRERDAFLLDVVPNPISRRNAAGGPASFSFMALIRDVDKAIVARDPEEERASPLFEALNQNAAKGKLQMEGKGDPVGGGPANAAPNNPAPPNGNRPVPPVINPGGTGGG